MRSSLDRLRTGNCSPFDEDAGNVCLVDKMIGNAYDVVKYVACHIDVLRYVATNMEEIHEVAINLKRSGLVLGETGLVNETVSIPLPEEAPASMVLASSVLIATADGSLFGSDSGYFTASIQAGALRLFLKPDAPVALQNAVVRWFITYGV